MLNFELYIPTKLYFGRGQCGRVGAVSYTHLTLPTNYRL